MTSDADARGVPPVKKVFLKAPDKLFKDMTPEELDAWARGVVEKLREARSPSPFPS